MTYLKQTNRLRRRSDLGWFQQELGRMLDGAPRAQRKWQPPFTLHETELAFEVRFVLPGANPDSLDVNMEGNVLRVSGDRPSLVGKARRLLANERQTGAFSRGLEFSTAVDSEHVQAAFRDGVLHVTLPKAAGAQTRHIDVHVAGATDTAPTTD